MVVASSPNLISVLYHLFQLAIESRSVTDVESVHQEPDVVSNLHRACC